MKVHPSIVAESQSAVMVEKKVQNEHNGENVDKQKKTPSRQNNVVGATSKIEYARQKIPTSMLPGSQVSSSFRVPKI